ncbi:MAG: hypothetical protein KGD57_09425 [Candidatus Lokiarchaeota archaeon]|nr:hypothetical protein [Candidatus Lokiarchaeota archaeon]
MIICTNCGSVNADNEGRICRKCGALLPISSKAPRLKITTGKKKTKKKETHKKEILVSKQKTEVKDSKKTNRRLVGEAVIFNKNKSIDKKENFELQEIPKEDPIEVQDFNKDIFSIDKKDKQILEEIEPIPYDGSILSSKEQLSNSIIKTTEKNKKQEKINNKFEKESASTNLIIKQQHLEQDMQDVLGFLSEKLNIYEDTSNKEIPKIKAELKEEIQPESMNQILKNLLNIDMHIEASAIIKNEGTILASAISDRISETLFTTIGQNLSMIGNDIINGLSAGNLYSIAIRGTEGVLHLAPLEPSNPNLKNMILIMFSNPQVKSGIINIAKSMVRKQVKKYLGIK